MRAHNDFFTVTVNQLLSATTNQFIYIAWGRETFVLYFVWDKNVYIVVR